jgi:hypothetical protein
MRSSGRTCGLPKLRPTREPDAQPYELDVCDWAGQRLLPGSETLSGVRKLPLREDRLAQVLGCHRMQGQAR